MQTDFHLKQKIAFGQEVFVTGSIAALGNWDITKAKKMSCLAEDNWQVSINIPLSQISQKEAAVSFTYKYLIKDQNNNLVAWEPGKNRICQVTNARHWQRVDIFDFADTNSHAWEVLNSSAFKKAIFARKVGKKAGFSPKKSSSNKKINLCFRINVPKLAPEHQVCLTGDTDFFGNWDEKKVALMEYEKGYFWQKTLSFVPTSSLISYKYAIYDNKAKKIIAYEEGDRIISELNEAQIGQNILRLDDKFKYVDITWRGVGVVIPVFSLRSNEDFGVGDFLDLKLLANWCEKVGIKLIQIMPINDTSCTKTWFDSYPYAPISVFALHPLYLNLKAVGLAPKDKATQAIIDEEVAQLDPEKGVAYEKVLQLKLNFIKLTYLDNKKRILADKEFKKFIAENYAWLAPYAAFCYLRDLYETSNFQNWGKYQKINDEILQALVDPKSAHYDEIAVHYFIQFHLYKQLQEAADYIRNKGIVLKGDIPVGVNRYSVETWYHADLFDLQNQIGAPPDYHATVEAIGRNWEFPAYNWQAMAADKYAWWQKRLQKMAEFFTAFRVDHILGFFRTWEIPYHSVIGLMGHFNPSLPVTKTEPDNLKIGFDEKLFCTPYLTKDYIYATYGDKFGEQLISDYLVETSAEHYALRPEYATERQIEAAFAIKEPDTMLTVRIEKEKIKNALFDLTSQVMFLKCEGKKDAYSPRILLHKTALFNELKSSEQARLINLYNDYFYQRHDELWTQEARKKLPAIINATKMLVCGEDLGMIPNCVPKVMAEFGILSLCLQRFANEISAEFSDPAKYPYLSVATPANHDMPSIRGFWEENAERAQRFYHDIIGCEGKAPKKCPTWVCDFIIKQHLDAPSIFTIVQLQDFLATGEKLRIADAKDERINSKNRPKHYWHYRLNIKLEDLLKNENFNRHIAKLIEDSGRNRICY